MMIQEQATEEQIKRQNNAKISYLAKDKTRHISKDSFWPRDLRLSF